MGISESKNSFTKRKGIEKVVKEEVKKETTEQRDFWSSINDILTNSIPADQCTTAGDPVNVATGSFTIEAVDLTIDDRGMDLCIKRRYNSVEDGVGLMGRGWTFEYDSHLKLKGDNITVVFPDGHVKEFVRSDSQWKNNTDESEADTLVDELATGGFVLNSNNRSFQYDNKGKLVCIRDRNGNSTTIYYNNKGEINSIVSPGGKVLSFAYSNNKISKITDNIGRNITYKYDGDNLVEVTFPNDGTVKYAYENNRITKVTDPNGVTYVVNEYDEKGRVIKQFDSELNETKIEYDDEKRENTFTYLKTGVVERYRYNSRCLLSERIYKDGTSEKYTYDKYCNKNSETDRNGNSIKKTFDSKGNILIELYPNGYFIENQYDNKGNLVKTSTSGGTETVFSYDDRGNLLEERKKLDEDKYAIRKYAYDNYGRMVSRTDPENNITIFEYGDNHIDKPTTVKDPEGNIFRYTYDEVGRMLSISTAYGTVRFEYNEINRKTRIIDPEGNITNMEYDKMGNLIKKVLPNSHKTGEGYKYRYDAMDRLIETIDPFNNVFAVKYDIHDNLIKEINPNYYDADTGDGIGVEYRYDDSNRKVKTIFPTGGETSIEYDSAGNIIKTVGPVKAGGSSDGVPSTQYQYDEMNRLTKIISTGAVQKEFEYDGEGRIVREKNAKGLHTYFKYNCAGWLLEKRVPVEEKAGMLLYRITQYQYDLAGRKIKERISPEYVTEEAYPDLWNTISYTYDKLGRMIKVSDSTGAVIEYSYDCLENRTLEKIKVNDKKTKTIRYQYNSRGLLSKKIEEIDGEDLSAKIEGKAIAQTIYEYDPNGNIKKVTTPEGYTTELFYDASDRIVKTVENGKTIKGRETYFQYDCAGNVIKETDCNGNSIKCDYDSMNRRIRITDKEGGVTRLFYDEAGNVVKRVNPEHYKPEEDDGLGTSYKYDGFNRLVEIKNALGMPVQQNIYNAAGELVEQFDATQKGVKFNYDLGGRVKEVYTPGALKSGIPAQQYTYDAMGNITGIKDGEGNFTHYSLDLWGRIEEISKADGSVEKYTYDYAGNITSSTDGNGNTTVYDYNSLNALSQIVDPAGDKIVYKYDHQGRVSRKIDRNRRITEYVYDIGDSLLLRRDLATGTKEEFSYYADGSLKSASSGGVVYTYDYTPNMKLKSRKLNGKPLIEYTYDKNNKVVELRDITKRHTTYKYDLLGRIEEVWDKNKKEAQYRYNSDNTIASISYANGVNVKYSYDEDKNLTGIVTTNKDGEEIFSHSYVYDVNGNQVEHTENGETTRYIYDKLNRLSKVVYPEGEESFEYDPAGNRIKRSFNNVTVNYDYDKRNRLIEKIEGGMQTAYRYDPQGNLLEEEGRRGTTRYTYDCFNRTESVRSAEGGFIRNRYDAEGLRFELNENGKVSRFIYSGSEVVTEVDADYRLKAAIIRGHELLAQKDSRDSSYYYLNNAHGDVTALVDGRGEVANRYRYDAFGNTVEAKEQIPNRFRYAGEQFDAVTGQYYLRARFYNPVVGRFTQEDTYRNDGLNLYSYVQNNPVNYYDPSGYSSVCSNKSNPWNEFQKANKGKFATRKEAVETYKKNIEEFEKLKNLAKKELDFSTEPNGAVFWSGNNMLLAQRWAKKNGKTTLEQTVGGKYLDSLDLFGKDSPIMPKQAAEVWDIASKRFADGASGTVYVFSTGAKKLSPYGNIRTWWRIEKPALKQNKKVNKIVRMKKDGTPAKF